MTSKEYRKNNLDKIRKYNMIYHRKMRIKAREPIEVERNGYKYILIRAKLTRLESKIHPAPEFMGYKNYVLHKCKKIIKK